MLLVDAQGDPEREGALARQLADQLVDGLVVSPLNPADPVWEEIGAALPVVTVGDALAGPTVGEVLFDNRAGVTLVLEHLHGLGHRRVAVMTPSRPSTPDRPAERIVGDVCAAFGLDAVVVNARHSIDDAAEAASGLLRSDPRPTAVFCLSDSGACGVYAAAAAHGLDVPGDVSVAGYDGHPIARVVTPPLTTVEWGMTDVATAAAGMLAEAVGGAPRAAAASAWRRSSSPAPRRPRPRSCCSGSSRTSRTHIAAREDELVELLQQLVALRLRGVRRAVRRAPGPPRGAARRARRGGRARGARPRARRRPSVRSRGVRLRRPAAARRPLPRRGRRPHAPDLRPRRRRLGRPARRLDDRPVRRRAP